MRVLVPRRRRCPFLMGHGTLLFAIWAVVSVWITAVPGVRANPLVDPPHKERVEDHDSDGDQTDPCETATQALMERHPALQQAQVASHQELQELERALCQDTASSICWLDGHELWTSQQLHEACQAAGGVILEFELHVTCDARLHTGQAMLVQYHYQNVDRCMAATDAVCQAHQVAQSMDQHATTTWWAMAMEQTMTLPNLESVYCHSTVEPQSTTSAANTTRTTPMWILLSSLLLGTTTMGWI